MKCHMKTMEGCARLLEIKADEKEMEGAQAKVLRDFERVARIPGFRVGKAPRELVERHYEKEARQELVKRFIPELYDRALKELHLEVVGLPEISEVHVEGLSLSFKAKVETKPEIPLRKYKGLKVQRKKIAVTPEEIRNNLRAIQEERAELVPKEGTVEENDYVVCDLEGRRDGKVTENRKNILIPVLLKGEKHPEFMQALLGAKGGEAREAEVTLESPGGVIQKVHYHIQIHEVKKKTLPEITDELAKAVSSFQTVRELEEAISKELLTRKEQQRQQALEKDLLDQLQRSCPFDLPRVLIEGETRRVAEEEHLRFKLLGLPDPEIEKKISQENEVLLQEAQRRVRNALILEKIAEIEKIEVGSEEINAKIRTLGDRLRRDEKQKERDLASESLRRRMGGEILFEKALAVVVENAQIQEES